MNFNFGKWTSPLFFSGVRVARSLVFCVVFCKSLFVLFSLDHCIVCTSFNLWLLITPLISSNYSYKIFLNTSTIFIQFSFEFAELLIILISDVFHVFKWSTIFPVSIAESFILFCHLFWFVHVLYYRKSEIFIFKSIFQLIQSLTCDIRNISGFT